MKFVTWNVNGLRACIEKGFYDFIKAENPDAVCIQEIKMQPHQAEIKMDGYYEFWNSAERKGYSGTLIFTKKKPVDCILGLPDESHNNEGRLITLDMGDFYLVNQYIPNSKEKLARLDYRLEYEDEVRKYLSSLDKKKPVVMCGDLNVAHNEIDLKNPSSNRRNAGFTDEERNKFTKLLEAGFIDVYRYFYPEEKDKYTWWSYRFNARSRNAGWRIDYFVISKRFIDRVKSIRIMDEVLGSDHCPVIMEIS
jgi:exodeoxyribonuclease III